MRKNVKSKNILILTSNVGSGHLSIAKAYGQIIKDNSPKSNILVFNTVVGVASWGYRFITSHLEKAYFKVWNYSNSTMKSELLHKVSTLVAKNDVLQAVKSFEPSLVISTNAFSASIAHRVLQTLKMKVPIIVVIADPFSMHKTWTVFKDADLYLSPTSEAKEILIKSGIKSYKISTTGWPVRKEFYIKHKKAQNKRRQILITSGGEGLSYVKPYIIKALRNKKIREGCHFDVICARNKELYLAMKLIKKLYPKTIKVHEFVNDIHILMRNSDLIVGKPGPNFLYETITLAKPFIAIGKPIGQELGNYEFIKKNKIGHYCQSPKDFQNFLLSLLEGNKSGIDQDKLYSFSKLQKKTASKIWKVIKSYIH